MSPLTVLVTGAGGFLGEQVVHAALAAGHRVRAQVRRRREALDLPGVEQVEADLRAGDLAVLVSGVDAVIHCAAAKGGDFHIQYASTVRGTQRLLDAVDDVGGVERFVLCSSFAVYDYAASRVRTLVDETSRVDAGNTTRDAYAQTKILQEDVVRAWVARTGAALVVLRPGVVYDADHTWTYRVGERFGRLWIALGSTSQVPLVHVEDCAGALVHVLTGRGVVGCTFNVLADDPPDQRAFRAALALLQHPSPWVVPVPWRLASAAAWVAHRATAASSATWRLPGFLDPGSLAVRSKPLRFSSEPLREAGWTPVHHWREDLRPRAGAPRG